jgi:hypothetical protein
MITDQQRKALHKGFEILANALNELGNGMHVVLNTKRDKFLLNILRTIAELVEKAINYLETRDQIQILWDKDRVKDALYRPVMIAMHKIKSTADKDFTGTKAVDTWDEMIEHLFNNGYIEQRIPFPSIETKE